MNNTLLPCPFCGGKAFVATLEHSEESRPHGYRFHGQIMCLRCQATAGNTGFDATREEATRKAIVAWNRRADAVPVVRGEWIPAKDPYDRVYCYRHAGCGCEHNEQSAYCPNCGAKMEDKS